MGRRSKAAIYRLTRDEGKDPEDDSEINAVRDRALELIARTDDDLTDVELFARQANDDWWWMEFTLESLHRLPSEVDILCREWTQIQAHSLIKQAMQSLQMSRLKRE